MTSLAPRWSPRSHPLTPEAVAALGDTVPALVERLLRLDDEKLSRLKGVATPAGRPPATTVTPTPSDAALPPLLIILGAEEDLPWVPGVHYLGRDPAAPHLYLPTALTPDLPLDLLDRAASARYRRTPLALLPTPPLAIPLDDARPLHRGKLAQLRIADCGMPIENPD